MPLELGELRLFDVKELAQKFKLNPITLRAYIRTGKITGRKIGTRWYISEESLRQYFLTAHKSKARKEASKSEG